MFLLFFHENICCGYSLEVPWRGTPNEYPHHMFTWRNKKKFNIFLVGKSTLSGVMSDLIRILVPMTV